MSWNVAFFGLWECDLRYTQKYYFKISKEIIQQPKKNLTKKTWKINNTSTSTSSTNRIVQWAMSICSSHRICEHVIIGEAVSQQGDGHIYIYMQHIAKHFNRMIVWFSVSANFFSIINSQVKSIVQRSY